MLLFAILATAPVPAMEDAKSGAFLCGVVQSKNDVLTSSVLEQVIGSGAVFSFVLKRKFDDSIVATDVSINDPTGVFDGAKDVSAYKVRDVGEIVVFEVTRPAGGKVAAMLFKKTGSEQLEVRVFAHNGGKLYPKARQFYGKCGYIENSIRSLEQPLPLAGEKNK
jgi:hypothetical protein